MANLRLFNAADRHLRLACSFSELLDDHVELLAVLARVVRARPSSRGRGDLVGEARPGSTGEPPRSSSARTSLPFVALLKWLTTMRRDPTCCSTRTVATREARSRSGRQKAAYVLDRRSTTRPLPAASRTTGSSTARQCAETTPRPGRLTPPASRYGGIRSAGRTSPNSDDVIASELEARRRGGAVEGRRGRGPRRARRCRSRRRGRWASRAGARCGVRHRPGSVPARVSGRRARGRRRRARSAQ